MMFNKKSADMELYTSANDLDQVSRQLSTALKEGQLLAYDWLKALPLRLTNTAERIRASRTWVVNHDCASEVAIKSDEKDMYAARHLGVIRALIVAIRLAIGTFPPEEKEPEAIARLRDVMDAATEYVNSINGGSARPAMHKLILALAGHINVSQDIAHLKHI